jgi:hypothetical protein
MSSMSVSYTLVFELNFAPNYKWTKCGKCFNTKTSRQIKQTYNSGCLGYNIQGKFKSLKYLRKNLVKIKTINCPF